MSERLQTFISDNDIYLFGMPGVGKTSFVKALRETNISPRYISIGEITKQKIAAGDESLLQKLRSPLPWDLDTVKMLVEYDIDIPDSYMLDGVPRKLDETYWILEKMYCRHLGQTALLLTANDDDIWERIAHRQDRLKTLEVITSRKKQFEANFQLILDTMKGSLSDLISIDTSGLSPLEVVCKLEEEL